MGFAGVALLLGLAGALLLARRLKRQTLGLEPTELADLVREHEAVLHGVRDGVVAVDRAGAGGRIAMANDEARRLLGRRRPRPAPPLTVLAPRLAELAVGGVDVDRAAGAHRRSRVLVVTGRRVSPARARPRHGADPARPHQAWSTWPASWRPCGR